jgi:hypothetical protein
MIPVREQLAAEWMEDLDVVIQSGDSIMDSYMANVRNSMPSLKSVEDANDVNPNTNTGAIDEFGNPIVLGAASTSGDTAGDDTDNNKVDDEWSTYIKGGASVSHTNVDDGLKSSNNHNYDPPKKRAFDRNGPFFLRNKHAFREVASSPLRGGNFDLLVLLATQEATIRLLRNYRDDVDHEQNKHSYDFLREFYITNAQTHFDGSGDHGRADDFLELLMLEPPRVSKSGREVTIVDPLGLAEQLIHMRREVALEWKTVVASSCVIQELNDAGNVVSSRGAPDHEHIQHKLSTRTEILKDMALNEQADDMEMDIDDLDLAKAKDLIEADVKAVLAAEQEQKKQQQLEQLEQQQALEQEEQEQQQLDQARLQRQDQQAFPQQQQAQQQGQQQHPLPPAHTSIPPATTAGAAAVGPLVPRTYSPWKPAVASTSASVFSASASTGLPYGPPLLTPPHVTPPPSSAAPLPSSQSHSTELPYGAPPLTSQPLPESQSEPSVSASTSTGLPYGPPLTPQSQQPQASAPFDSNHQGGQDDNDGDDWGEFQ